MDPVLVTSEVKLNPAIKKRFAQRRNVDVNSTKIRYTLGLVGEFTYRVRSNGLGYAIRCVKKYV
jgi:hypothetical protein